MAASENLLQHSGEENDQLERSNKKIKGVNGIAGALDSSALDQNIKDSSPVRKKALYKDKLCDISKDEDESMCENSSPESDYNSEGEFIALSDSEDEGEDDERCPRVRFSAAKKASFWKPRKFSIIVKVLRRRVCFKFLATKLYKVWQKAGTMELIDLCNDIYLARLSNKEDYIAALQGGPWMIIDHLVPVAKWLPHFDPFDVQVSKITAWVRFPGLPIEYYNFQALMKLGALAGKSLYVDKTTLSASRGKYARVCAEIDLSKTLLAKYQLKNRIYRIEYEGLHNICFNCGTFGHNREQCPSNEGEGVTDGGNSDS